MILFSSSFPADDYAGDGGDDDDDGHYIIESIRKVLIEHSVVSEPPALARQPAKLLFHLSFQPGHIGIRLSCIADGSISMNQLDHLLTS